ncbi:WbqC family protein [Lentiprolixibacter aurantiacus]|uniref:WbqC family protein n=1 Tax=Lentiprolixibacter aurantiacus TaxID=2993939 RepID=A0AAE3MMA4_9FLAO|nr:WbqC family protein [Lentiprolixibacter aurantiacus]MCX2720410.1 WbqC family protein [Lentiprolixibacter aurantiacus]
MPVLLHPVYFPNIHTFSILARHEIVWETWDNYQKQTYRNRCYICTDQGRLMLNIPIKHVGGKEGRQLYRDVQIDYSENWPRQHWRTLQTAYRTSPFFEFYEDDLAPLFERKERYLMDFNLKTIAAICECLQLPFQDKRTKSYLQPAVDMLDARDLVHSKGEKPPQQVPYIQVFGDRHGFISNLSILDLLFNEGSRAVDYLRNQTLSLDV